MTSYITSIGTAVPQHKISQSKAALWMTNCLQLTDNEQKKLEHLYNASGIETRYSVIEDFTKNRNEFTFFSNSENFEPFPMVAARMEIYKKHALPLAEKAINNCLEQINSFNVKEITHLIVVSCTGMYAPGLDIEIITKFNLNHNIERTSIQFMGCYAAFNGLKSANYIVNSNTKAKVLLVCVELCTIHFQKNKTRDHLISNALFADGAAAVIIEANANKKSYKIEDFSCALATDGKEDMAWHIANHGFEMTLSSYIPKFIGGGISELASYLLQKSKLEIKDIQYFAIHPGGRKILEVCEKELNLTVEDNCFAYEVLRDFGNMSSATVLFVLKNIMNNLTEKDNNKNVLSFAFGPGLTMESMLLNIQHA